MEAELTKKKISEKDETQKSILKVDKEIQKLETTEKSFIQLKKDFDEYERNKLIKEKY